MFGTDMWRLMENCPTSKLALMSTSNFIVGVIGSLLFSLAHQHIISCDGYIRCENRCLSQGNGQRNEAFIKRLIGE